MGIASGFVLYKCLTRVFNDFQVEISLTLAGCYLAFYFGDIILKVSGVLTIVFMGLYTSKNRQAVSPAIEETMHHFWEMISFLANTILFFVTGQVVAFKVIEADHLNLSDLGVLIGLYVVCHITRALSVLSLPFTIVLCIHFSWFLDMANVPSPRERRVWVHLERCDSHGLRGFARSYRSRVGINCRK